MGPQLNAEQTGGVGVGIAVPRGMMMEDGLA